MVLMLCHLLWSTVGGRAENTAAPADAVVDGVDWLGKPHKLARLLEGYPNFALDFQPS
ncbi:hypothetical protein M4I32_04700 [Microbacterium sp. LRZ72]|uniref:hypothetical protein n=1 Tax=Microbacterium sp. LRZ72 TaxID=2942481 RepID=UPI0029BAE998|nr:hypothetical protein [Microbacterium sp. LRZ72]MDX2376097.1 hypothetical protein [Microbacterium sp. LRZ72]